MDRAEMAVIPCKTAHRSDKPGLLIRQPQIHVWDEVRLFRHADAILQARCVFRPSAR